MTVALGLHLEELRSMTKPDHVQKNEARWNQHSEAYQREHASQLVTTALTWGVWSTPETQLQVLGDVAGLDILELGCGGAQWSIGLTKRGARVTGLDVSEAQLRFARELIAKEGVDVHLVHASAEQVPLPDASFDIVFCDHGAMSFCDPRRTVPEAARLLRLGGLFAFNIATPFLDVCWDDGCHGPGERLLHDYFGMHRFEDEDTVSFQLAYGEWIRLFRQNGFFIEDLIEIQPPDGATSTYRQFVTVEWARRFPAEHIWKVRKRGGA